MKTLAAVLLLVGLTACTGSDEPASAPTPSASATAASPAPPPRATPAPVPAVKSCYALSYDAAVAPTASGSAVSCSRKHTAVTYAVGPLDTLVDGHLLAVDSARVQQQVATACPARFGDFVGGSVEDRRLSMLRPVWFTPTVEESDAGASWFRCDVVALATDGELAPLSGPMADVLSSEEGRDRYGMCGTASPGTAKFSRVICSAEHSWRAIAVVPLGDGPYPGKEKVRAAGQSPCQDAGAEVAPDTLEYQWGYEWPTAEQWKAGQTFGRCWAPD
ncbi:MAG TPA: septum formation family protein [Nocardioides sp.]|nr:septum formation family protein [Nocardioides sp.]